jgi:hypothetical protein
MAAKSHKDLVVLETDCAGVGWDLGLADEAGVPLAIIALSMAHGALPTFHRSRRLAHLGHGHIMCHVCARELGIRCPKIRCLQQLPEGWAPDVLQRYQ